MGSSGDNPALRRAARDRRVDVDLSLVGHVRNPTLAQVQAVVAQQFGLSREDLCSPNRDARRSWARHVAMFIARNETRASLPGIGAAFGNRGHTTVLHGIRRVSERVQTDPEARREVVDALAALWLGLVELRLYVSERAARNAIEDANSRRLDQELRSSIAADPNVRVTDLARSIIHERYSAVLTKRRDGAIAGPSPSATWAGALTVWLVLLESAATTPTVAAAFGNLNTATVVEAVRRVNSRGRDDPRTRDELVALVEALRSRRNPSPGRIASALATSPPILTESCDANTALLCPSCAPTLNARKVTATVCKYFDTSPAALRRDDREETRWARDIAIFLIYADRQRLDAGDLASADKQVKETLQRVRDRVVNDAVARDQFLTILATLQVTRRYRPRTDELPAATICSPSAGCDHAGDPKWPD